MSEAYVQADDPKRPLVIANADDANMPHIGLTGDTYTGRKRNAFIAACSNLSQRTSLSGAQTV